MKPTRTYKEWKGRETPYQRVRSWTRDLAIRSLAFGRDMSPSTDCIRFPYYHHVFDDERKGFERQIRLLQGTGDFLNIDEAVALLNSGDKINGRYFCLSFDDGLKSCIENAVPILADLKVPSTFYVVTSLMGASFDPDHYISRKTFGFKGHGSTVDFLTWEDCKKMIDAGMTIGSHTVRHSRLSDISMQEAEVELRESKSQIERNLSITCDHFCAPYGSPDVDYNSAQHPKLAKKLGYRSFATGFRGHMTRGGSPFSLKRDHLLANWGLYQVRYFFSAE